MRSLGNRITKHTPTRGFSAELSAAITTLLASRLGLPISTTQCITGAVLGVGLANMDLRSINWKQLGKIFLGWVFTLPCAGLISGIIMGMALNVPTWGRWMVEWSERVAKQWMLYVVYHLSPLCACFYPWFNSLNLNWTLYSRIGSLIIWIELNSIAILVHFCWYHDPLSRKCGGKNEIAVIIAEFMLVPK